MKIDMKVILEGVKYALDKTYSTLTEKIEKIELKADLFETKADAEHVHSYTDLTDRTHYTEEVETSILPLTEIEIVDQGGYMFGSRYTFGKVLGLTIGNTYTVIWNGTEYSVVCFEDMIDGKPYPCLGDYNTTLPFNIYDNIDITFISTSPTAVVTGSVGTHTIEIKEVSENVVPLDEKYIPDNIARKSDIHEGGGSGIYVGSDEAPAEYDIQIDPDGEVDDLVTREEFNQLSSQINNLPSGGGGGNQTLSLVNLGSGIVEIVLSAMTPTSGVSQNGNKLNIISGVTVSQNGNTLAIA